MATFLFDKIVFGPVQSRRLGVSLGINLLPTNAKWCSFNCIYCECGWTSKGPYNSSLFPSREKVRTELYNMLKKMKIDGKAPDVITFAGNGEPTIHPEFPGIIDDTVAMRNDLFPLAQIAVLSNASMIHMPGVFDALKKIEQNILKLDSGIESTIRFLNQPHESFSLKKTIEHLKKFKGKFILQTLFVRGRYKNRQVDNTTTGELNAWLPLVRELNPKQVMIYTIARDTPAEWLKKVPYNELEKIASKVEAMGIAVSISA